LEDPESYPRKPKPPAENVPTGALLPVVPPDKPDVVTH
jgi:hypothetical protein